MQVPAYLILSRHNIYYFRVVVPPEIRSRFPGTPVEVRRSLGTRAVNSAIRLARRLSVITDEVFTRVMNNTETTGQGFCLMIQQIKLGLLELNGIKLDAEQPEQELALLESLVQRMSRVAPHPPLSLPCLTAPSPLSQVLEAYCSEQVRAGNWTVKTEQESRTTFALLQRIVGDRQFAELGHAELRSYKETLLRLPANLNKLPAFRGKDLADVIAMEPAPMQTNTIRKQLARVSALFDWAVRHGYTDRNYASGIGIKRKGKRDDEERGVYTDVQINTLKRAVLAGTAMLQKCPHQKWVPLIGMYSGLRLEEICQLETADICDIEGIAVFDINRNGHKRLKTENSRRTVPIHPELIRLGLLEYVAGLRANGCKQVFPELRQGRDGHSQSVSRWFSRYRKRLGIDRPFHSLRHTVSNKLREAGSPEDLVADILGHSRSGKETFGRYAKAASTKRLYNAICSINYDVEAVIEQ